MNFLQPFLTSRPARPYHLAEPFLVLVVSSELFKCYCTLLKANSVDPNQTPRFAASELASRL